MSEWVTNDWDQDCLPPKLHDDDIVEVWFRDGGRAIGQADMWGYSWNTKNHTHITKYLVHGKQASKEQVDGNHYVSLSIQPWDAMESWLTPEQFRGYLLGSAIKYLGRYNADKETKGGLVDVKKAIHFLNKLVETTEKGGDYYERC